MANDIVLRTEHISRILETEVLPVTLVKDASVDIRTHEFTAIKGPSGSGKSSLLYLLGLESIVLEIPNQSIFCCLNSHLLKT